MTLTLSRLVKLSRVVLVIVLLTVASASAYAQGCTQCRDNAAATPPATQRAYRHAIILLTVTAGVFFIGTVAILKRQR
jgi:hypothetical protein